MKRYLPLFHTLLFLGSALMAGYAYQLVQSPALNTGQALPSGTAAFETSLQSAITSSATSMTLTANSVRGGGALSGYNCFTIDEGSAQAETVCGTVSGTTVSNLTRGISQSTGTTTVAALQFAHRRGANVKITDYPLTQIMRHQLNGQETIPNLMTYDTNVLIGVGSPTSTVATKYYVDSVAVAGASDADDTTKGIVEMATAAEAGAGTVAGATGARLTLGANLATSTPTASCSAFCVVMATAGKIAQGFINAAIDYAWSVSQTFAGGFNATGVTTFNATSTAATSTLMVDFDTIVTAIASTTFTGFTTPQPAYIATSTGALKLADANDPFAQQFDGFVVSNGTNGQAVLLQREGNVTGFSGLTKGLDYYVQDTVGTIGTSVGTAEVYVGRAISSTELLVDRSRGMQYLGSQSIGGGSDTVINQPHARFAVIQVSVNNATCTEGPFRGTLTLNKIGITSATLGGQCTISGGDDNNAATFTWTSTSSIRSLFVGTSLTATAYYYR